VITRWPNLESPRGVDVTISTVVQILHPSMEMMETLLLVWSSSNRRYITYGQEIHGISLGRHFQNSLPACGMHLLRACRTICTEIRSGEIDVSEGQ
jgi:hypothetical protein